MVWPQRDGQVWSGGQQAGLLMRWRAGERPLEMRDMTHVTHSSPGAPTCCGDEGSRHEPCIGMGTSCPGTGSPS